ncbi:NAD-dependent epimerase/dehydratase family protein [Jeotgalicoccus sp. WY2]|uniref:NAD-dependent epimerase/dehydratase family protein n=1 Tax=Jeotgalicoccus sp. WY2 TaxID=2708346 RepID=UPI0020207A7B|nr:NAD(P)H-binding protein [Jeotgalicoccus sp. WY2]
MKKKNVLLMGVHGRIGEHLYLELNESAKLFAFSSPNQEPDHENITFIKKDLFILPEVEEALKNIDVVIFFEDPIMRLNRLTQGKFYDLYLLIADNIARAAATNNVEQIIYIADELSDGSIVSILGAYGTNVKETDTPIRRYGKNLTYKTKDYNSVRSVQRAPLPPGWTVENVAWYYFGWLDEIIYDFVKTKIDNNTISIYVLDNRNLCSNLNLMMNFQKMTSSCSKLRAAV